MAVQLLPDELIVEILSILPAKSLFRCRLVCKSWLNLIRSTRFKLMHLCNFNQLNPRYLVYHLDYVDDEEWYNVHLDDEAFTLDPDTQIECLNICFRIVGCCNGVVCVSDDDVDFMGTNFRFGYDKTSDDFKVVCLTYDASSSSTRPKFLAEESVMVSMVRESLAAIHSSRLNVNGLRSDGSRYMAMVMKEYKNPASWTKLYDMHYEDVDLGEPLQLRNNGDMIVELENRDIIMFNHNEGRYVYVLRNGVDEDEEKGYLDFRTYVYRYEESLALVDVGDSIPNKEAMKALMMIEKQVRVRVYSNWGKEKLNRNSNFPSKIGMAVELPDEVIVEILSILPAKPLLRCRLVCKSWLNLISSTRFKLMHLHNFNQLNSHYFVRRMDYYAVEELYDVHFNDEAFGLDIGTQIEFPFDRSRVNICYRVIGCCNGVVCLCDDDELDGDELSLDMIILWNPSIRRKLTLPLPMFFDVNFEDSYVVLGFGYDKMSDDFKVVNLTYNECSSSTRPHVEVYTVKTGIWREVMFPHNLGCFNIQSNWSQIFANGSMHWMASNSNWSHYFIMTFDMGTELFGEIQLPGFLAQKHFLKVYVVGESLAVIHSSNLNFDGFESRGSTYIVMVMKEHKNPASWTTLYQIHYEDVDLGKPLRLRNNSDMIVELENRDIIMFNHDKGCYVYVFCDGEEEEDFSSMTYVDKYVESSGLLDVGDSVPNKEAMKALMMIENQVDDKPIPFAFQSESVSLWHDGLGNPILTTHYYVLEEPTYAMFGKLADKLAGESTVELPFDSVNLCFWIVDCCNGVVCLSDYDEFNEYGFTLDTIILWNPSIRSKLTLPLLIFYSVGVEDPVVVFGFGYDKMSDDYKLVSLTYNEDSDTTRPKVEVYLVKTGIWREVMFPDNLRYSYIRSNWSQIYFNGCVHWIASDSNWSHYSIMTFDITTELFGEFQLPGFLAQKHYLKVSVVGESLAVIHSSPLNFEGMRSGSTYMVMIMIMKEYKNPTFWTLLCHIHYPDLDVGKPLRLRNNSDMIVELENRDMIMFNHDECSYVYVFRDGEEEEDFDYKTYVDRYVESLALLDVGDSVFQIRRR
ncbi:hypothetical protein OSB04_un000826 [Centaurea solstitialis]|uniref:F-box domain-containing protein n=1 Tax=Centaurea solstitialis TaxID=347529 RepID=A0AA38S4B6_9ASTR|nr:hypothetical protein OSB04_un000826 [Centaurea solstitialis]